MTNVRKPIGPVVALSVGLAIALGVRPISVREILAAYVLALTAIALLTLTRIARSTDEWSRASSELERSLAPRKPERTRPAELIRAERDLVLSSANVGELHTRLLPQLREVAAARLDIRQTRLADARNLLGDDAWELLRPDRPAPEDRSGTGLPLKRIAALLDVVEEL